MQEVARLLHPSSVAHGRGLPPARPLRYALDVAVGARASCLLVLSLAAVAHAQPLTVGLLPSRQPGATATRQRLLRLGVSLGAAPPVASLELTPLVSRADGLSAAGRLDEAAELYDLAVEQGTRAPLAVADPTRLLHAMLARAAIGLARGEAARADSLLGRALRWDPSLQLEPDEDAPRLRAAWARVHQALGARPPLGREDFGSDCAHLLVGRRLDRWSTELVRVEDCRERAQALARDDDTDATDGALLARLGQPPPPPAQSTARPRPLHRRAWLWITVVGAGVALAGAGVAIWAATRPTDVSWNVTPRL